MHFLRAADEKYWNSLTEFSVSACASQRRCVQIPHCQRLFYVYYIAIWICAGWWWKKNHSKEQTLHISIGAYCDGPVRVCGKPEKSIIFRIQRAGGSFCFFLHVFFSQLIRRYWSQASSIDLNDLYATLCWFFFAVPERRGLLTNCGFFCFTIRLLRCRRWGLWRLLCRSFLFRCWFTVQSGERCSATTGHTFEVNTKVKLTVLMCQHVVADSRGEWNFWTKFVLVFVFFLFISFGFSSSQWMRCGKCQFAFQLLSWIRRSTEIYVQKSILSKERPPHFLHCSNKFKTFCIDFYHAAMFTRAPRKSYNIYARWIENWLPIGLFIVAAGTRAATARCPFRLNITAFAMIAASVIQLFQDVAVKWVAISGWLEMAGENNISWLWWPNKNNDSNKSLKYALVKWNEVDEQKDRKETRTEKVGLWARATTLII